MPDRQTTFQHIIFPLEPRALKAVLDGIENLRHAKRFENEVRRACPQSFNGGVEVCEGSDQNHLAAERLFAQLFEPAYTAAPGQRNIQHDEIDMNSLQDSRAFFRTAGLQDRMTSRQQSFD